MFCAGCDGSSPALSSSGPKIGSNGCSKGFDPVIEVTSGSSVSSSKLHSICLNFKKGMYLLHRVNVHKTKYLKCSRRQDELKPINIENKEIEQVRSFKYLGSTVHTDDTIEEEIKERIALGNKVFFANKKIFQSKLIHKKAKLKLYFLVIRPVVTYACKTWILKETITNRRMVFERKTLRKIFGPTYENGFWRIKTNEELDKLIKHKNIINFARAQRLEWCSHIERMQETRMVKAIHSWKHISKRPTGRLKIHWEDDIKKDTQRLKVPDWKTFVRDRRRWKEVVEKAKTLHEEL